MARKARVARKTSETDIRLNLNLDGSGKNKISTGIPFFDHMLTLFTRHGLFDLELKAAGDIEVDFHHTVEDVGLCLGEAIKAALKDKAGIKRYGSADVPMMDSLATVILDISGRPYLNFNVKYPRRLVKDKGAFDPALVEEFMKALSNTAGLDLHITLRYAKETHHAIESIFKAFGRALSVAVSIDPRIKGVMSTKGKL